MKAKIYPLNKPTNEVYIPASSFLLHLEIILASFSNKTSVISNLIDGSEIDNTIAWCENFGAKISNKKNKLVITGISVFPTYKNVKNPMFVANNKTTPLLLLPFLCLISQPFGIRANEEILKSLEVYRPILEGSHVIFTSYDGSIRLEDQFDPESIDLRGVHDKRVIAAFLMIAPLLEKTVRILFDNDDYIRETIDSISKLMKQFGAETKIFDVDSISFNTISEYKGCEITTEMDLNSYLYSLMLGKLLEGKEKLIITNYQKSVIQKDTNLINYIKKNIFSITENGNKVIVTKKKEDIKRIWEIETLNLIDFSNNLPFCVLYSIISSEDVRMIGYNSENAYIAEVTKTLQRCLSAIGLTLYTVNDKAVISPITKNHKNQIDCKEDKYCMMMFTYLALFLKEPIILKHVEYYLSENKNYFNYLRQFGVKVEIIHN